LKGREIRTVKNFLKKKSNIYSFWGLFVDKGKIIGVIFGWFSVWAPFALWIYLGQDAFLPPDLA